MYPKMITGRGRIITYLLDANYNEDFSCISHQVDEQKDVHDKYEMGDRYVKENKPSIRKYKDDIPFDDLDINYI